MIATNETIINQACVEPHMPIPTSQRNFIPLCDIEKQHINAIIGNL